jgi:hypothetical protein
LGPFWAHLGAILAHSGPILGPFWAHVAAAAAAAAAEAATAPVYVKRFSNKFPQGGSFQTKRMLLLVTYECAILAWRSAFAFYFRDQTRNAGTSSAIRQILAKLFPQFDVKFERRTD